MTAGRRINSLSQEWNTPQKYVDAVKAVLGDIALDPCSNEYSIVRAAVEYRLPLYDGLRESWKYKTIYVNPPYGRNRDNHTSIYDWLKKCEAAHYIHGSEVLALVPVATNTKHWKQFIFGHATAICFLYDTRLKFLEMGQKTGKGAPMACAMIYWGNYYEKFNKVFMEHGAVVDIRALRVD